VIFMGKIQRRVCGDDFQGFDGDVDTFSSSSGLGKRFDPFEDNMLSVEELMNREQGLLDTEPTLSDNIVRGALDKLLPVEADIMELHFSEGKSISDISDIKGLPEMEVSSILSSCVEEFVKHLNNGRKEAGISLVYNDCSLCNHPSLQDLNEFLHVWLDSRKWDYGGICSALRDRFNLEVSKETIRNHVKYHFYGYGIIQENDSGEDVSVSYEDQKMYVNVSKELLSEIDWLARKCNKTRAAVIRESVQFGLKDLVRTLILNKYFVGEGVRLMKADWRLRA